MLTFNLNSPVLHQKGKKKLSFLQRKAAKYLLLAATLILLVVLLNNLKTADSFNGASGVFPIFASDKLKMEGFDASQGRFIGDRIVHLDLKGAPPRVSYYAQLFPMLARMGATGLLIEYEDMFPYTGSISNISAKNAYHLDEIDQINKLAKANHLQIIPLVQTFGHLGFVLKLAQYKQLREVEYPQVICPTHNQTVPLLLLMIEQLLERHPYTKNIHIGCDEVNHIGVCNRCEEIVIKNKWSKFNLYLEHIKTLAKHIKARRPNMNVLIWDDILRNIDEDTLKASEISSFVTPVVWKYAPNIYAGINKDVWDKYASIFPSLWVASAFKGASGSNEIVTNSDYHVANHQSWLLVIKEYANIIKFQGFLITGWQRYDHFAVLCELLPMGIPSLDLCLWVLNGSAVEDYSNTNQISNHHFPGGNIVLDVMIVKNIQSDLRQLLRDSRIKGWMNDYNVKYSFSNPEYVTEVSGMIERLTMELVHVKDSLYKNMINIYDNYTVTEWMETYIDPLKNELSKLWLRKEKLLEKTEWTRRPYGDEP